MDFILKCLTNKSCFIIYTIVDTVIDFDFNSIDYSVQISFRRLQKATPLINYS